MPHPYFSGRPHPRILAHRGFVAPEQAAEGIVENSRAAVAAAIDLGVDFVETDCRTTRDGVVVLFHDAQLTRVLGVEGRVADVTHAELEALMADRGGLLTLEAALREFPDTRFNVDVKAEAAVIPAGHAIGPHGDRVLLTSFSDKRRLRALAVATQHDRPRPATSPGRDVLRRLFTLVTLRAKKRALALLADVDALQIPERQGRARVLTKRLLHYAHLAGVEVHVWTVNEPSEIERLAAFGVDGIVTDRSDFALNVLGARREG